MSAASSQTSDAIRRAEIDRSLRHPVMFFFTSGAAWLAVAILLGIISSAKLHSPDFLSGCSFLTYGRVQPAHMNALIYGWGCQAAFGSLVWLMARLSRQECRAAGLILTRYLVRLEPIASMSAEQVVATYAPVIQHFLTGDIGGSATLTR